jgi:hypothetical protein
VARGPGRRLRRLITQKQAEYEEVKWEAWRVWERSKADGVKKRTYSTSSSDGSSEETVEQYGNPAYLQTVLSAVDTPLPCCQLWGRRYGAESASDSRVDC